MSSILLKQVHDGPNKAMNCIVTSIFKVHSSLLWSNLNKLCYIQKSVILVYVQANFVVIW